MIYKYLWSNILHTLLKQLRLIYFYIYFYRFVDAIFLTKNALTMFTYFQTTQKYKLKKE